MVSLSREERRRQLLAKYPPPPLWKQTLTRLRCASVEITFSIFRWLWLKSLGRWTFVKRTRGLEEVASLRFVRAHTSIPVPRVFGSINFLGKNYAFIQRLPGRDILQTRWNRRLTDAEKHNIHAQLRGFAEELRAIRPLQSPAICSVLGGPVRDYRICTDGPHGPYADEAEMNFQLRLGILFDDIRRVYCDEPQRERPSPAQHHG
ncbi:hypothetical protein EV421DRAFT_1800830 [Armillaria borealis]|uniref:Aminoglycoside phosphotransferase domain-containing protein n=1 Tax=Armillaria borealis TaxID=47425 RepID=A0AA39MRH9_9AGAR|nr:hypothetical protein EV421DRAFT_1800830 [Armillaria borealis]